MAKRFFRDNERTTQQETGMKQSLWTKFGMVVAFTLLCLPGLHLHAQKRNQAQATLAVTMLSDIHFDPYQDPSKFKLLLTAPIEGWEQILNSPASATQADDFNALQKACHARGPDSSWALLQASLIAAHKQQPKPLFVTVSGDLLTHGFDCRLHTLMQNSSAKDVSDFAAKTVAFVALQVRKAFPDVPVYMALGNNDAGCSDYRDTPQSDFLQSAGQSIAGGVPAASRNQVLSDFSDEGDYNVPLPPPMQHTRLIVLQDLFESRLYYDCTGKADPAQVAAAQIVWLKAQLVAARQHGEKAWVMAHIPPGVDVYSSFHKYVLQPARICDVTNPLMFLDNDALTETLTSFADVVKLAIFAHTHMDEVKLLHNGAGGAVPAKLVPSISPVNGNNPSFIIAQVNPRTATLVDYADYVDHTPDLNNWSEAYRYSSVYGLPDFGVDSAKKLVTTLASDRSGDGDWSRAYQKWFYPGDLGLFGLGLHQVWPAYACAMLETNADAFRQCMCPAKPAAK